VILSFDLLPEDTAFVLEAKSTYELWRRKTNKKKQNAGAAYIQYLDSKIPLADYNYDYEMPELIIGNDISEDRIKLEGRIKNRLGF